MKYIQKCPSVSVSLMWSNGNFLYQLTNHAENKFYYTTTTIKQCARVRDTTKILK